MSAASANSRIRRLIDAVRIEANHLSDPDDLKTAIAWVELCCEIGNSTALRPFAKREVMPGTLPRAELVSTHSGSTGSRAAV